MPGMRRFLNNNNPLVVSSFHSALLHQLVVIAAALALLAIGWNVLFTLQQRSSRPGARSEAAAASEPPARRFLRVAFGLVWLFDGLLQAQSAMPLGMPTGVLRPAASGSPSWVVHLVDFAANLWTDHPVQAAAGAVWVQVGIGVFLLVASRGRWSRLAGLVSLGWALVVWSVAEAFGGVFAPGGTWLFGLPGAALFYAAAGVLLVLPDSAWQGGALGRAVVRALGLFYAGMAVLQAWPGRGFWQGGVGSGAGPLVSMVRTMSGTSQPRVLSDWLRAFAGFDAAHGWAVNLFVVVALGLVGVLLLTGRRRAVLAATVLATVVGLATWVLVQDLGFLGGLGTDPNSMVPLLLLLGGGVLALVRQPAVAVAPLAPAQTPVSPITAPVRPAPAGPTPPAAWRRWLDSVGPVGLARSLAAVAALFVVLVGAVPMAAASTNSDVTPLLSEAIDGPVATISGPAPGFTLVDQHGRTVSLADLSGKAVALTFLDPVCTSDCPIIAQNFHRADELLGSAAKRVEFIAVVANPIYHSLHVVQTFDRQEGLSGVDNWLYLTGTVAQLHKVWSAYGVQVEVLPGGSMVNHSELAYVIDGHGKMRALLNADPGTTSATSESFSSLLAGQLRTVLG